MLADEEQEAVATPEVAALEADVGVPPMVVDGLQRPDQ
jgi:hypothetical protein